jgi:hypothetical protein
MPKAGVRPLWGQTPRGLTPGDPGDGWAGVRPLWGQTPRGLTPKTTETTASTAVSVTLPRQLVSVAASMLTAPACGEKIVVWPSSQRTRRRGGSSAMTSSTTPFRGGCVTRSDSTTIRSPACAFTPPPPPSRLYNATPARAVRASRLASRRGSGVRLVPRSARRTVTAVSASVRQAACTARGRVPQRVRSQ